MNVIAITSRRAANAEITRLELECEALYLAGRELERENERLRKMLSPGRTTGRPMSERWESAAEIAEDARWQRILYTDGMQPDVGMPYASIGTGDLPSEDDR